MMISAVPKLDAFAGEWRAFKVTEEAYQKEGIFSEEGRRRRAWECTRSDLVALFAVRQKSGDPCNARANQMFCKHLKVLECPIHT